MANPKNIEGLQWKKGQSGNPAGKPKGTKNISTHLRELLEVSVPTPANPLGIKDKNVPVSLYLALRIVHSAMKGDKVAIATMLDRLEGKPKETIDTTVSVPIPEWIANSEDYSPKDDGPI